MVMVDVDVASCQLSTVFQPESVGLDLGLVAILC